MRPPGTASWRSWTAPGERPLERVLRRVGISYDAARLALRALDERRQRGRGRSRWRMLTLPIAASLAALALLRLGVSIALGAVSDRDGGAPPAAVAHNTASEIASPKARATAAGRAAQGDALRPGGRRRGAAED